MPDGRGDIHRIGLAISANAADGCEALLVGAESTIGRVERRAVKGAPWPILRVRRLADCSRGDQDAEKTERELHLYSLRTTLSRATPDRQSSSVSSGAKFSRVGST